MINIKTITGKKTNDCLWLRGIYDGFEQEDDTVFTPGCNPNRIVGEAFLNDEAFKYCPYCSKIINCARED